MPAAVNQTHQRHWSLARRLLWISLAVVLGQSIISMVIATTLRQHLMTGLLKGTLQRQSLLALHKVNNQLDQLTATQAQACCSPADYQRFLQPLRLNDGKAALILGSAGLVSTPGSRTLFKHDQLLAVAEQAIHAAEGFTIVDTNAQEAVAAKAIKLPGGQQTGHFVYLRPVYAMPAVKAQSLIKLGAELILILLTGGVLVFSARRIFRPVRSLSQELASIELNTLGGATLPTDKAPLELLPILNEFNGMVERLRRSAANQKQFASTISHEFRTPLTVISGFIQSVLNRSEGLVDKERRALGIADLEVLRLNRMLSDLLDLSRADNHQLAIRQEPFELIPSLEHALRLARAAHSNPISDNLSGLKATTVVGDSDRLVQCIGNLIGNAAKYSKTKTPIAVQVTCTAAQVSITVRDQGQGIPNNQLERIFERFTRAEGVSLPYRQSSSGLGLSIVKMLIEAMGGTVSVESTVGEGSAFSLHLPLAPQP